MYRLIILSLFLFSGCATSYGSKSFFTGGYSDFRVSQDTFVVSFEANASTSHEKVLKYALRRASEITIENGYSHFVVTNGLDTSQGFLVTRGNTKTHYSSFGKSSSHGSSFFTATTTPMVEPALSITIKCYSEKPEGVDAISAAEYLEYNKK